MVWPMAAMAAISAASGYDQNQRASRRSKEQQKYLDKANAARLGIDLPKYEELKYVQPEFVGKLEDNMVQQDPTAFNQITSDPRFQQAQVDAMDKLGEYQEGGLTAADKLSLAQTQQRVASDERGQRQAIMQNMAERGIGGGGAELAMRMQAQQGGADRASMEGMQTAAGAQNRALEAIMKRGQLGGDIRTQDFNEQARKAQARDAVQRFNTGLRADARTRDMRVMQDRANQSAQGQMWEQGQKNQQAGQRYKDEMSRATGDAGYMAGTSKIASNAAQQGMNTMGNLAQAGIGALGSYGQYRQGQDDMDKDRADRLEDRKWAIEDRNYKQKHSK